MKLFTETNPNGGTFTAGSADDALVFTSPDVSRYRNIQIKTNNPVDVEVSMDRGVTWTAGIVGLEDVAVAAAVGTRVLVTAAGKIYRIAPGLRFTNFRLRQNGASNVTTMQCLATDLDRTK
jgi:hypothetical protein